MASQPVKVHVADVLLAVPASIGVEAGMVVLDEDEPPRRSLRIIIGQPEARAIMAAWQGAAPGRPSTWDLFVSAITILGARIDRAVITAVQEERHYFASIQFEQHGEQRVLACRPSDAVALALRAPGAELFVESSVLDAAGRLPDGTKPVDREAELDAREAEVRAREEAVAKREAALGGTDVDAAAG